MENAAIWNKLSPVFWWSEGYKLKPAAEVLAVHPTKKADTPRSGDADEKHPLMVQQFVGAGRSMFFGIDETWRWRFREDELRFNQFWIQTVRYLARSRIGRVELRLDRQTPYRRGEPIKVTVRFPDDMPEPAKDTQVDVSVVRTLPGKDQAAIEKWDMRLEPVTGYRATYEGTLTRTPEGTYRFRLKTPEAKPVPSAEGKVIVPPDEMDRLRMNREEMEQAAEESQGRFYTLADADRLIEELPSGQRVALALAAAAAGGVESPGPVRAGAGPARGGVVLQEAKAFAVRIEMEAKKRRPGRATRLAATPTGVRGSEATETSFQRGRAVLVTSQGMGRGWR